jgi:hypothetical protein
MNYKMVSDRELSNFRRFMRSGIPMDQFGPHGAFDAKPSRRARDEEKGESRSYLDVILDLKAKMSRDDFKSLLMALLDDDGAEDDEFETPMEREMSQLDKPADKRKATEKPAMDSAGVKSFNAMFPEAGHIKCGVAYAVASPYAAHRASSTSAEKSFASMYPDAAAIKVR